MSQTKEFKYQCITCLKKFYTKASAYSHKKKKNHSTILEDFRVHSPTETSKKELKGCLLEDPKGQEGKAENDKELCDCGFPQSFPVPHTHSLSEGKAEKGLLEKAGEPQTLGIIGNYSKESSNSHQEPSPSSFETELDKLLLGVKKIDNYYKKIIELKNKYCLDKSIVKRDYVTKQQFENQYAILSETEKALQNFIFKYQNSIEKQKVKDKLDKAKELSEMTNKTGFLIFIDEVEKELGL